MMLSILEAVEMLKEDGEGSSPASVAAPVGSPVAGVNTTADVATYPQYLGFSYRGGKLKMHNKKRKVSNKKRLLEESLSHGIGSLLKEYSEILSKFPRVECSFTEN